MQPHLNLHHVARLELTPRMQFTDGDFCTRDLIITDTEGNRFTIGLFADTRDALQLNGAACPAPPEAPELGGEG